MTLRAVLIGAQTFNLTGVHTDVEVMHRTLADHGFTDIRAHTHGEATYAGITRALDRLCRDTRRGDGVVVYFSGHGSLHGDLQYLVPVDIEQSTPHDFRGYLAAELTVVSRVLARLTPNVTCVLDSCHADGAVRGDAPASDRWLVKSAPPDQVAHDDGFARNKALARENAPLVPNVVRLTASQQHGPAFEAEVHPGRGRQGVFTAALADALRSPAAHHVPWSALIGRVRDRVKQRQAQQRPDAGGPAGRLPFSLEERSQPERLPLVRRDGRFIVPGGALFGLDREDTLRMVFPCDAPWHEATDLAAADPEPGGGGDVTVPVIVDALEAGDAVLEARPEADPATGAAPLPDGLFTAELPPGSYALPLRIHDRRLVRIEGGGALADALRRHLGDCPRLAETHDRAAFATVRLDDGTATVLNADGLPLREPLKTTGADASGLVELLEVLARGERVRALGTPEGEALLSAETEVRFEIQTPAHSGTWRPLEPRGERLHERDRYRVTVTNHSDDALYFWVLGVGLSGRTALVTNDRPGGYRLEPRGAPHRTTCTTKPIKITWPRDVPRHGPRPETVHLVIGDRSMDLNALTDVRRSTEATDPALIPLLQEVWEAFRDQEMEGAGEFHYSVHTVHATAWPYPGGSGT
ncbi:caspase domain-containing protein [Streptomyces sp. NPDC059063]|uniref:caspase family protein n=1 Tax=unclassified Streptomyces TaxID=2593676 RepID=UPI003698B75A